MRRLPLLVTLLVVPAFAVPTILIGPQVTNITHQGARFVWETDTSGTSIIAWDTTSHAANGTLSAAYASHVGSAGAVQVHFQYLSGLLADTQYYFRVCANDGAEACSPEATFTTLALPVVHPAPAILPTANVDISMPTQTGVTWTVGADCDDPATGLLALWKGADWGDTINIPTTTVCGLGYKFAVKAADTNVPHRWIVIQTANAASLPAPGARVGPADAPNMPLMEQNHWGHGASLAKQDCFPGAFNWDLSSGFPGWYMNKCDVVSTASVIGATGIGAGNPVSFTLSTPLTPAPVVNQWGYVTGVAGIAKANGVFQITGVTDASHFTVSFINGYIDTSNSYTGGGTLSLFDWVGVPRQTYTGAAPVSACATGEWAYNGTGVTQNFTNQYSAPDVSVGRVWRCVATNTWKHHWIVFNSVAQSHLNTQDAPLFDLANVHHVRFIGLNVTHAPVPYDVLLRRGGPHMFTDGWTQSGAAPFPLVWQDPATHHVIWDRCYFHGDYPSKWGILLYFHGDNVAFINSYLYSIGNWFEPEDIGPIFDNIAGDKIAMTWGGPKLIYNSFLEGYGITVHSNDFANGDGEPVHDVTVSKNWFYRDPAKLYGHPSAAVDYFMPLRQLLELKSGIRFNVNGNTFENNYQNVSQAAAIMLTPTPIGTAMYCDASINGPNTDFLCRGPFTISMGQYVWNFTDNHLRVVTAVAGPRQFTVAGEAPSGHAANVTGISGVYDINIQNNTFKNMPTVMGGYSHGNHSVANIPYNLDRVTFKNNLVLDMGAFGRKLPNGGWQAAGGCGYAYTQWGGNSDTIFDHNTFYLFRNCAAGYAGYETVIAPVPTEITAENEGFQYTNNLHYFTNTNQPLLEGSTNLKGMDLLTKYFSGSDPFKFSKNVVVRAGANPTGYPASNTWGDPSSIPASSLFTNLTSDFTLLLRYRAPDVCFAAPGDCSTDNTDSGVNMLTLLDAQSPGSGSSGRRPQPLSGNSALTGQASHN